MAFRGSLAYRSRRPNIFLNREISMTTASDLLNRHFETLVADPAAWRGLIADDLEWELAYAPSLGHPARLSGRAAVERHVGWLRGAVEGFRFLDLRVYPFTDPYGAVAEVRAEGRMRA